jgi:hypothetical protein
MARVEAESSYTIYLDQLELDVLHNLLRWALCGWSEEGGERSNLVDLEKKIIEFSTSDFSEPDLFGCKRLY